jgi:hypothetical protein
MSTLSLRIRKGDEINEISAQRQKLEDRQKPLQAFAGNALESLKEIQVDLGGADFLRWRVRSLSSELKTILRR